MMPKNVPRWRHLGRSLNSRILLWSQTAITTFLRDRRQYEGKVAEQCRATVEVEVAVLRSKDICSVSDDMLLDEMQWAMMNDRVSDVTKLIP
ncbi:hypothetical protein CCR75_009319 [Bremia lactucae]|uniref:Uncharacterized protein n=1 Tax=Bremia lactucae TaxID=4779 RepID=A0A976P034_BRELC|nr:hypothetical protein CCR75_009319 [Bremia lactucae]